MKKILFAMAAFAMGMAVMPNVYAAYNFDNENATQQAQIQRTGNGTEDDPYILKLIADAIQDIEIANGKHVVIDLNNYKLTNYCTGCSAIWIQPNAVVTIKDSGSNGTIELKNGATNDVPLIKNEGTLIVESGTIKSNSDYSGANRSTGIYNVTGASLTINGGTIETASDNAWGITNLGTAVINGGTFNQNNKLSMIENSADLTINNGTFTSNGIPEQEGMITNDKGDQGVPGKAISKISGGNFDTPVVINTVGDGNAIISGGQFSSNVGAYLAAGLVQDVHGKVATRASLKPGIPTRNDKTTDKTEEENNTPVGPESEGTTANSTTDVKNPNTSDNFYSLVSMLTVSAAGLFIAFKKITLN